MDFLKNRIGGFFGDDPRSAPRSIHKALRRHQLESDWDLKATVSTLIDLAAELTVRFKIDCGELTLGVGKLSAKTFGTFRESPNELGVERTIVLNAKHVAVATPETWFDVAGTLLHELLHAEQAMRNEADNKKRGRQGYHDDAFVKRAWELGLIVDRDGRQGYRKSADNPLFALLGDLGFRTPKLTEDQQPGPKPAGGSSLLKYVCACEKPQTFRSGRSDFEAICPRCDEPFRVA